MESKFKVTNEVHTWHSKISHIEDMFTQDDVCQYMIELSITPIVFESLSER